MKNDFIRADKGLIARDAIIYVEDAELAEKGYIDVHHKAGIDRITGFFALEAIMLLKPSALEGRRFRWHKRAWFVHNVVAHPVMQFMALAAQLVRPVSKRLSGNLYEKAMRVHDATVPVPTGFRHQAGPGG